MKDEIAGVPLRDLLLVHESQISIVGSHQVVNYSSKAYKIARETKESLVDFRDFSKKPKRISTTDGAQDL